ncbi:myelin regulatory factor [Pelobates cultripes]|uniref:Myelin regulatory factor n=1 Tax=Pelobates cultripes TaxID=61616 RepID=A0AAD1RT87_PELCU|nr:myelin regulatory factor [Pelobates cultripes]
MDRLDVIGENEALQQFFEGQDMHKALENPMVDTSMLEEYISSDFAFGALLPDSPPDSGSEPCSPPQINGSCRYIERSVDNVSGAHPFIASQESCMKINNPGISWQSSAPPSCMNYSYPYSQQRPSENSSVSYSPTKKRKHSHLDERENLQTWNMNIRQTPSANCMVDANGYESDEQTISSSDKGYQSLTWKPYQMTHWGVLCNANSETLPVIGYQVITDKGFNFSTVDEAYVCQKKNHFQVTVHIRVLGSPKYIKGQLGLSPIESFHLKVFGVKVTGSLARRCVECLGTMMVREVEAANQTITIEQSQSDRSKRPFNPVVVNLPPDQVTKVTLGRLHFSETTANNMRKKGKPNPDQRYFILVVGLYALCQEQTYLVVSQASERIIVRASNPGQFLNDNDVLWQRGHIPETVVSHGRIGINTDTPDEALVVCGNVKVMGTVMHPSDIRAKTNIQEVDTMDQLRRIAQMRLVEYDYKPEFASAMGIDSMHETGIIAQEVRNVFPQAVKEAGNVTCENGTTIENLLMVDKDKIFMENVGAVKQLCKLTNNLETRIEELEVWNQKLDKMKRMNSLKTGQNEKSPSRCLVMAYSKINNTPQKRRTSPVKVKQVESKQQQCPKKIFQITVFALISVMMLCALTISTLYTLYVQEEAVEREPPILNYTSITSTATSTLYTTMMGWHLIKSTLDVRETTLTTHVRPTQGLLEMNFCGILPCHEVQCCEIQRKLRRENDEEPNTNVKRDLTSLFPMNKRLDDPAFASDWIDTSISSVQILENQQIIDHHYCSKSLHCRSGKYSYVIPVNKYTPTNMRISLEINTTEPLIVYRCKMTLGNICNRGTLKRKKREDSSETTQGFHHVWILPVAQMYDSEYHLRVATPVS